MEERTWMNTANGLAGVLPWRRRQKNGGGTPAPDWLSRFALESMVRRPVGPQTPEETRAYRLAKLLVSEMQEFCGDDIRHGLRHKDLYSRLKLDIDRSREAYLEMTPGVEKDFLAQELLFAVAGRNVRAFGPS